jgi:hypothetical protein
MPRDSGGSTRKKFRADTAEQRPFSFSATFNTAMDIPAMRSRVHLCVCSSRLIFCSATISKATVLNVSWSKEMISPGNAPRRRSVGRRCAWEYRGRSGRACRTASSCRPSRCPQAIALLHQDHARACLGSGERRAQAGHAAPQHHDVGLLHDRESRACSTTAMPLFRCFKWAAMSPGCFLDVA